MLFCLFFIFLCSVKINSIRLLSGSVLLCVCLGIGLLFFDNARKKFIYFFTQKKVWTIFSSLYTLITFSCFISISKETYDFSLISGFITQAVNLFGVILYYSYHKAYVKTDIMLYVVYVYVVQSFFQVISYISPEIKEILNMFRNETQIKLNNYGLRGYAVGEDFVGLGIAVGLTFIVFFNLLLEKRRNSRSLI